MPLFLGGEVDCVRAPVGAPNPGLEATVELKTNKVVNSERTNAIFVKKLLKHWAQSFLLGVPVSHESPYVYVWPRRLEGRRTDAWAIRHWQPVIAFTWPS